MRVIDALQLPEVMSGTKWIALPLPGGYILPTMTIGVKGQTMLWCDGIYGSPFGSEAALKLHQLLGECTLVDATKAPAR